MIFSNLLQKITKNSQVSNGSIRKIQTDASHYDIVLHIGSPKAGTSALQNFLLQNRVLLEQNGFFYPQHGLDKNGISGGHSQLAIALIEKRFDDAKELFNFWEHEAKQKDKTLLLSSESFFNIADKLEPLLEGKKVLLIAYHRNIVEYIISVHNQLIKRHFGTQSLEQYVNSIMTNPQNTSNLVNKSFSKTYKEWESVVGRSNLIVRSYQSECFIDGKIEVDFLTRLKIKPDRFKLLTKKINISYIPDALELKRIINNVLDKNEHQLNHRIDMLLQAYSEKMGTGIYKVNIDSETLDKLKVYLENDEQNLKKEYLENYKKSLKSIQNSVQDSRLEIQSLKKILEQLLKDQELKHYLVNRTKKRLGTGNMNYLIFKLAELLDIEHLDKFENTKEIWFPQDQLNNMANGKYKEADFLRDISRLLIEKGDLENADKLITRALAVRPNGPVIIKIKENVTELKMKSLKERKKSGNGD